MKAADFFSRASRRVLVLHAVQPRMKLSPDFVSGPWIREEGTGVREWGEEEWKEETQFWSEERKKKWKNLSLGGFKWFEELIDAENVIQSTFPELLDGNKIDEGGKRIGKEWSARSEVL